MLLGEPQTGTYEALLRSENLQLMDEVAPGYDPLKFWTKQFF